MPRKAQRARSSGVARRVETWVVVATGMGGPRGNWRSMEEALGKVGMRRPGSGRVSGNRVTTEGVLNLSGQGWFPDRKAR
jgi:hypothetical protein